MKCMRLKPCFVFHFLCLSCIIGNTAAAQYYYTGTTFGFKENEPLPFVKMRLKSNGMLYRSGNSGDFGLPSTAKYDTAICFAEGYDTITVPLVYNKKNTINMRLNATLQKKEDQRARLSNLTPNLLKETDQSFRTIGETYAALVENDFVKTRKYPTTGYSPSTNKASYANIRRFLNSGMYVTPEAVRLEEMVNYFSLSCTSFPPPNKVFQLESRLTDCPWNNDHLLLFINAQAKTINLDSIQPANLVFLIDNSGSMDTPNRLPLLKSAFTMLVKTLREKDRVAIVTYGGAAGIWLPPTPGNEKEKILASIANIEAGGATAGSNGIQLAYELIEANPIPNANNRVILATDGDFNVGISEEKALEFMIKKYKNSGVYLTCLGVGMGNYKDSKIETLARFGNGNFAYLDSEQEAEKVLVQEFTKHLYGIAINTTIELTMNPDLVNEYRLIGYDNQKEALSLKGYLLGSEIGAGYSLVSMLEIVPNDSTKIWKTTNSEQILGNISIHFSTPQEEKKELQETFEMKFNYVPFSELERSLRFASAVTMFGNILRKSSKLEDNHFDDILRVANESLNPNDKQQVEFIGLVEKARILYEKGDNNKRKNIR